MSDWHWHELNTIDIEASSRFYSSCFGWAVEHAEFDSQPYKMLMAGGRPVGGIAPLAEGTPQWSVYISVADCDAGAKSVAANGGAVHFGPVPVPGVGRIAGCADPQGAGFFLIEPAPR